MNIESIINKLSKKGTTRIESVHLLKSLKKELREKASSGNITIDEIRRIFQQIIEDTDLIDCPTFIVRLYIASCFSDAFYIFVPNIPLSTTGQLDAIFQLFSTVIPFNCQEGSTEYSIIQSIIDVLNGTDSYLLISNRDVSFEMIESMIKIKPISMLNNRYDSNFQSSIKFLVNLINSLSSSLIIADVEKLFSVNFNSSLIVQKVLPLLSQNLQMGIVGSLQQNLSYADFMKAFVTATKILKMSFGFIVRLLYPELINQDDSQRMTVFSLLNEIFHHNKSEISSISDPMDDKSDISEDIKSINFILSRNVDKCPKIRLIIIQIASFLIESKNSIFYEKALKVIKSIHYDPNEAVRFSGLDIIWNLQKQNLLNEENESYTKEIDDVCTFLSDKSQRIREKTLMYMCELIKLGKERSGSINIEKQAEINANYISYIDKIIVYCFEKPGTEIFMVYSFLFDIFDSTDLYEMTTEKTKYMKSLNFIKTTCEYVKKYVETGNLSNNNLVKLLTKEIWKPFLPNKKLLQIREKHKTQDAIQVILKITNEQFAKEFSVLTIDIPVNTEKLIYICNTKTMIKDFASFNPKLFIPYLSKILERCDKECVSILPFIFEYVFMDPKQNEIEKIRMIIEVFIKLITVSTQNSLIVLAKLVSKWNYNFSTKRRIFNITKKDEKIIFSFNNMKYVIDYQKFTPTFSVKFFFFLGIPDIVPNFFVKKSKKELEQPKLPPKFASSKIVLSSYRNQYDEDEDKYDSNYVKWSLRISSLFDEKEIIRIHFYFINSYPLQCLESLLRISNVISHEYSFSILLPNKSVSDVYHHFKFAQKKGKNLLNMISAKKFRKIASLLINLGDDEGYSRSNCYSKLNEKFWIISMIDEALKNPKTPIEFLSLIVLGLAFEDFDTTALNDNVNFSDIKTKIYEKAHSSLIYHVNLRRKFANQASLSPSLIAQSETDLVSNPTTTDQAKKTKKSSTLSKSSSNDQIKDEKFIKAAQSNQMISDQQVELMIPSLFNVLAFFYYYRKHCVDYRNIIDKLFDISISNNQHKGLALYAINEVRNAINPLSAFGKRMIPICDYASSKIFVKQMIQPVNFHINQKFVVDEGNEL